jgi:hypothetical protein
MLLLLLPTERDKKSKIRMQTKMSAVDDMSSRRRAEGGEMLHEENFGSLWSPPPYCATEVTESTTSR